MNWSATDIFQCLNYSYCGSSDFLHSDEIHLSLMMKYVDADFETKVPYDDYSTYAYCSDTCVIKGITNETACDNFAPIDSSLWPSFWSMEWTSFNSTVVRCHLLPEIDHLCSLADLYL